MLSAYMADCNSNVIIPAPYDTQNSETNEWTIDWTGWDGAISIRWNVRSSSSRESQLQQQLLLNNLAINYLWNGWYNKKNNSCLFLPFSLEIWIRAFYSFLQHINELALVFVPVLMWQWVYVIDGTFIYYLLGRLLVNARSRTKLISKLFRV